jgi:hypothetical protein
LEAEEQEELRRHPIAEEKDQSCEVLLEIFLAQGQASVHISTLFVLDSWG